MITQTSFINNVTHKESHDLGALAQLSSQEIEKFSALLSKAPTALPEKNWVQALQIQSREVDERFSAIAPSAEVLNQPMQMLATQKEMAKMTTKVELIAKVAGSISQSINKLVNLQ